MQEFLDLASNWAERNDLPLTAYRSEDGHWMARIDARDGQGWFAVHVPLFERKRGEGDEDYQDRVERRFSASLVKEREYRIKKYTGRSPAIGRAA